MTRGVDLHRSKVLFVDDEEQALKYFRRAFEKEFQVLTAPGVAAAKEILDQEGDSVGVVISDQRMPKQTGVDLLRYARETRPTAVRILTTAYSDLDSAIDAVNSGEIFRYVTKPWDIRELRGVLLRAMEFHAVQRERDALLCEKLSVIQRMLVVDRVRSLAVLAATLEGRLRFPLHGLKAYLELATRQLQPVDGEFAAGWDDLWAATVDESQQMLSAVEHVLKRTTPTGFTSVTLEGLLDQARDGAAATADVAPASGADNELIVDAPMVAGLLAATIDWVGSLPSGDAAVRVTAARAELDGRNAVEIIVSGVGRAWAPDRAKGLVAVLRGRPEASGDLLASCLVAAHHAGRISLHQDASDGPQVLLLLPQDAPAATLPPLNPEWLEAAFERFEP